MSKISFNSNIASLQAQRRLTENTKKLAKTQEKLSSGLRINSASDDAAGVAIASNLHVDGRVYGQAIRNLNDGVSLYNVAEGSYNELLNIAIRSRELAEQSANGVLSSVQRQSIDTERQALFNEYDRIVAVTEYNGKKLLDGSLTSLTLQAGYATEGVLTLEFGQQLVRNLGAGTSTTVGDGTFRAGTSYSTGTNPDSVTLGDINGDGKLDIVSADAGAGKTSVLLGNGNGTFQARTSYSIGAVPRSVALGDVNGDGKLDIVSADNGDDKTSVLLGNGNGTFQARTSYSTGTGSRKVALGDINGDGKLDIVSADSSVDKTSVLLGNGNGTFQARTSYSTGDDPRSVALGDVNGDGKLDIVSADYGADKTSVLLGNGNGTFQARTSYSTGGTPRSVALGDVNGDNALDIAVAARGDDKADILLANTTTPISFLTQASSLTAIPILAAIQTAIENDLAIIGSNQSRIATAVSNVRQARENFNAAESRIVDVDVALESAELVKRQILQDTSSAILAQANQEPVLLLSLLK